MDAATINIRMQMLGTSQVTDGLRMVNQDFDGLRRCAITYGTTSENAFRMGSQGAKSLAVHMATLGATGNLSLGSLVGTALSFQHTLVGAGAAGAAAFSLVGAAAAGAGYAIKLGIDWANEADEAWKQAGISAQGYVKNVLIGAGLLKNPSASQGFFNYEQYATGTAGGMRSHALDIFRRRTHEETAEEFIAGIETDRSQKAIDESRRYLSSKLYEKTVQRRDEALASGDEGRVGGLQGTIAYLEKQASEIIRRAAMSEQEVQQAINTFEARKTQAAKAEQWNKLADDAELARLRGKPNMAAELVLNGRAGSGSVEEQMARAEGIMDRRLLQLHAWQSQGEGGPQFAEMNVRGSAAAYQATIKQQFGKDFKQTAEKQLQEAMKQTVALSRLVEDKVRIAIVSLN